MPQVEKTIVIYLSPVMASSLKALLLPSKVLGLKMLFSFETVMFPFGRGVGDLHCLCTRSGDAQEPEMRPLAVWSGNSHSTWQCWHPSSVLSWRWPCRHVLLTCISEESMRWVLVDSQRLSKKHTLSCFSNIISLLLCNNVVRRFLCPASNPLISCPLQYLEVIIGHGCGLFFEWRRKIHKQWNERSPICFWLPPPALCLRRVQMKMLPRDTLPEGS